MNGSALDLNYGPLSEEIEETTSHLDPMHTLSVAVGFTWVVMGGLTVFLIGRLFLMQNWAHGLEVIGTTLANTMFWSAVLVGLLAQAIDGALGMAYGVTATTFLLGAGISPVMASAGVHIAKIFTGGFSGVAHVRCGNVDKRLFMRLMVPGVLGGIVGTVVVTQFNGAILTPFISGYLVLMGLHILRKAMQYQRLRAQPSRYVSQLGLFGGFVDAIGGGGWGPVVTSTLMGSGNDPRITVGSVNFAEFFVALASAASFSMLVETNIWPIVGGLVLGGLVASPFAASVCKHLRPRTLMRLVGVLITMLSLYNL